MRPANIEKFRSFFQIYRHFIYFFNYFQFLAENMKQFFNFFNAARESHWLKKLIDLKQHIPASLKIRNLRNQGQNSQILLDAFRSNYP